MGNSRVIMTNSIAPERSSVNLDIFNMMIVIPMLLFAFIMSSINLGFVQIGLGSYGGVFGSDSRNELRVSGVCTVFAALLVLWVKEAWKGVGELKSEDIDLSDEAVA